MKHVFLVLTVLFFCGPLFAEDIYESNLLGMKLKRINDVSEAGTDYFLIISQEENRETRRLFKDGTIYSVTRLDRDGARITETTEKNGATETIIRENGVIATEIVSEPDESEKRTEYLYESDRLEFADYFINDEKIYRDSYYYTDKGRLLDVKRTFDAGDNNVLIAFVFNEGRISRYWFSGDNQQNYIRFDKNGIVYSDLNAGDDFRETRTYSLSSDGNRIEQIENIKTGITTMLYYDNENRLVSSIRTDGEGQKIEETGWKYTDGLLTEMRIKSPLSLERFEYEYSDDEKLKKEVYVKNGIIIQTAEYEDDQNYSEVLYRNGKPVLRIEYENGIRANTVELQE